MTDRGATDPARIEAASWVERMRDAGPRAPRAAFERWRKGPGNAAAYRDMVRARDDAEALAGQPELLALRHQTLARASLGARSRRPAPWFLLAAACLAVAAPVSLWRSGALTGPAPAASSAATAEPVYRTAANQQMTMTLEDGSRVTLDAASSVRFAYDAHERRLILERGQARFEVAKHRARPFVVAAGGQTVTAHGTAFDVRIEPDEVRVVLVEGKVSVASAAARSRSVMMEPNDVLTATAGGITLKKVADANGLSGWRDGLLVFEDQPLAEAAAEMNRYSSRHIRLGDDRVGRIRISGSFARGEIAPFIDALRIGFPVRVEAVPGGDVRLSTASPSP